MSYFNQIKINAEKEFPKKRKIKDYTKELSRNLFFYKKRKEFMQISILHLFGEIKQLQAILRDF